MLTDLGVVAGALEHTGVWEGEQLEGVSHVAQISHVHYSQAIQLILHFKLVLCRSPPATLYVVNFDMNLLTYFLLIQWDIRCNVDLTCW